MTETRGKNMLDKNNSVIFLGFEVSNVVIEFAKVRAKDKNMKFKDFLAEEFLRLLRNKDDKYIIEHIKEIEIKRGKK